MEGTGQGSRNSISLGRWDLKTWASVEKKVEGLSGLGLDVAPERLAEFFRKAEWEASDRKTGVKPDKALQFTGMEPSGALWGSQAQGPFCSPYLVGKTPAVMIIMIFPEFQRVSLNSC